MIERSLKARTAALAAALLCAAGPALAFEGQPSPAELYGELYERVEMERLYPDSKTFADAIAKLAPEQIIADYREHRPQTRAALADFVRTHFELPASALESISLPPGQSLREHIAALWPHLIRPPVPASPHSSQLAFGFRHVVPGGRFREIYYWDSYFTMLGLIRDGHADVARDMVDGFADLIARYGHIPNGTRSYYLSRSQPPFFFMMVSLLSPDDPASADARYLGALRAEYTFWMRGAGELKPGEAAHHVVMLADGAVLNRYRDERDTPRDESYREDVELARRSPRPAADLYREIRSAAESGWDFSSRWFADGKSLATIETTSIVPVDLNALLYGLEHAIEQGCARLKDQACVQDFTRREAQRKAAIDRYLWDATCGCYFDYQWRHGRRTGRLSAATLYPLFTGAASAKQAAAVARIARQKLLARGGLLATAVVTGQQWDAPNGWAPLQWIAVGGFEAYGEDALASEISSRWLLTVRGSYASSGKLVEKYNLETSGGGGGGEYPLQDGFGWTNGVTRALLDFDSPNAAHPHPGLPPSKGKELSHTPNGG